MVVNLNAWVIYEHSYTTRSKMEKKLFSRPTKNVQILCLLTIRSSDATGP